MIVQFLSNYKLKCCGCGACRQICPQKCILMQEDEEGFLYPVVDTEQCIKCGLCVKVCPIICKSSTKTEKRYMPKALGGWHLNDEIRYESSSGGAFTLFAEYVIKQGGIVYGCLLNEDLCAKHAGIERINDLKHLRGSKYIQSDIGNTYQDIKLQLEKGRIVLFTGTPCQAAGLNSFLGKKYANLYICDFICHGVPSPKVFRSYIDYLEHKYHDKIKGFQFRNKDKGWHHSGLQLGTKAIFFHIADKRFFPGFRDAFMNGFLDDLYLRPSCYNCRFKRIPKDDSDITIADFWGVKNVEPGLYDGKGTSLVLLNTTKGEKLFGDAKENFFYMDCDFLEAVRHNKSLTESAVWNPSRNNFFREYSVKPFCMVRKKYMGAVIWALHKRSRIADFRQLWFNRNFNK